MGLEDYGILTSADSGNAKFPSAIVLEIRVLAVLLLLRLRLARDPIYPGTESRGSRSSPLVSRAANFSELGSREPHRTTSSKIR